MKRHGGCSNKWETGCLALVVVPGTTMKDHSHHCFFTYSVKRGEQYEYCIGIEAHVGMRSRARVLADASLWDGEHSTAGHHQGEPRIGHTRLYKHLECRHAFIFSFDDIAFRVNSIQLRFAQLVSALPSSRWTALTSHKCTFLNWSIIFNSFSKRCLLAFKTLCSQIQDTSWML